MHTRRSSLCSGSVILALVAVWGGTARATTLTLDEAVALADQNLPTLRQARADAESASAQAVAAVSTLLPQVNANAAYQRKTANFATNPGAVPSAINMSAANSSDTFNAFNFGVSLQQTLFDGQTLYQWRSARATAAGQRAAEQTARLDAAYNVRVAYFASAGNKALIAVAKQTLENQTRHLEQTKGFVEVGTHPEIDLATARTNVANARVQLITAENNYETAKAQLNQAMGVERNTDYDVADVAAVAVDVEDAATDDQMNAAAKARPELLVFDEKLRAQELLVNSWRWNFAPTLGVSTGVTDAGTDIHNLAWNWSFTGNASWLLFDGLNTISQVRATKAQLVSLQAQRDTERLQVRLDVERGRLAVRAAKATVLATAEALAAAKLQQRLADGRYQAGVGNAIELADAELALANAGGQRVQAVFSLASARAQLLRALGRR